MICFNNICISSLQLIFIISIISILYYLYLQIHDKINNNNKFLVDKLKANEKKILTNSNLYNSNKNNINDNTDYLNSTPINITTQPIQSTSQIGMLYKYDIADATLQPGDNDLSLIMPLYARQIHTGSTKWIYYTNTNGVRVPIFYQNKQCDKDFGCSELFTDDIVNIPSLNGNFKVHINEVESLRYLPNVI